MCAQCVFFYCIFIYFCVFFLPKSQFRHTRKHAHTHTHTQTHTTVLEMKCYVFTNHIKRTWPSPHNTILSSFICPYLRKNGLIAAIINPIFFNVFALKLMETPQCIHIFRNVNQQNNVTHTHTHTHITTQTYKKNTHISKKNNLCLKHTLFSHCQLSL